MKIIIRNSLTIIKNKSKRAIIPPVARRPIMPMEKDQKLGKIIIRVIIKNKRNLSQ